MANAKLKTTKTAGNVNDFLNSIPNKTQQEDCKKIVEMMEEISGEKGKMWGKAIIGFVDIHLKYASGRELDWFKIGLSPRKAATTLYIGIGASLVENHDLLDKLGKHKTGKGCLYIKRLSDVDEKVLRELIKNGLKDNSLMV